MASKLPRRAAQFDIGKSSILGSLGRAFGGAARAVGNTVKGVAQRVGRAGQAGIAGLGSGGGYGAIPASGGNTFTKIIPGNPQAQPQAQLRGRSNRVQDLRPPQYLPNRPNKDSFSSRGVSMGGSWEKDPFAKMRSAFLGGGGGGSGRGWVSDANVAAYNKAFAEAKLGNESRYQELLGIADKTSGQRAKDIGIDFRAREANAMQQLARTGMANTTVAPTLTTSGGMSFGAQKNAALDRLADQMQQTKLGIIERRTDAYPDLASLASLGQLNIGNLKF